MDLVLLAAGFATRLEPLTLNQPKHLLPIKNGLFVDRLMDQLKRTTHKFGKKVIITNDNYFDKFKKFTDELDQGYEVYKDGVKNKNERIGAIGDLLAAVDQAKIDDDVLIIAMDFIFKDFDFDKLINFSSEKKSSVTVVRYEADPEEIKAGSCLQIDKNNLVTKFEEKPEVPFSDLYGAPYYLVKKEDLQFVRSLPKELWDNCGQIVKAVCENSVLHAFQHDGEYLHMTTLDDYNRLKEM